MDSVDSEQREQDNNWAKEDLDESNLRGESPDIQDGDDQSRDSGDEKMKIVFNKENLGQRCEVKSLYKGVSSCECCINWVDKKPLTEDATAARQIQEEYDAFAILRRKQQHGNSISWKTHSIVVNSPLLKSRLSTVFEKYPSVNVLSTTLVFESPFVPFVHRWERLIKIEQEEKDETTKTHLELLRTLMSAEIEESARRFEDISNTGIIGYSDVSLLFVPGEIIVQRRNGNLSAGVLKTVSKRGDDWTFDVSRIEWNGYRFGVSTAKWHLECFSGNLDVISLLIYPLEAHPDRSHERAKLIAQGRAFQKLSGQHFRNFSGTLYESKYFGGLHHAINERVIIDAVSFYKFYKYYPPDLEELSTLMYSTTYSPDDPLQVDRGTAKDDEGASKDVMPLSDYQCLLTPPTVKGFALESKIWVDNDGFNNLVLDEERKSLLKALASSLKNRNSESLGFDDFVPGKGKGMIILLQGPPGVGKTLTAETVSESLQCPLYRLDTNDLGLSAGKVEKGLKQALELCSKWNALLLIDEVDVFVEARSTKDLERNELVEVFLRTIEYYQGTMILTTNRAQTIDPAFESRIDVTLDYGDLSEMSRAEIWRTFLHKLSRSERVQVTETQIKTLAKFPLNGRQIKSAVKVARVLALDQNVPLGLEQLEVVVHLRQKTADLIGSLDGKDSSNKEGLVTRDLSIGACLGCLVLLSLLCAAVLLSPVFIRSDECRKSAFEETGL